MPLLIWSHSALRTRFGPNKPQRRSPDAQAGVDAQTASLRLFHFAACPFCRKVRRDIHLLGLRIAEADIKLDPRARAELVDGGGKKQVPCLRIEEGNAVRWLYESTDITAYLRGRFA